MLTLRHRHTFARCVLVWFALALGAAAAAPLVRPQAQQQVCTAAGVFTFVGVDEDGPARGAGQLHDCPSCILAAAPPPQGHGAVEPQAPGVVLLPAAVQAHTASRAAPALPARGPPAIA